MFTTDMKKPLPKTVAELKEMNFDAYVCVFDSKDHQLVEEIIKEK